MTYGQVLFELGIKKESLQKAQDMLHENEELLSALENPTITKKEKENVVEKLFSDDIKSFLKVVCDNDDIACFDETISGGQGRAYFKRRERLDRWFCTESWRPRL